MVWLLLMIASVFIACMIVTCYTASDLGAAPYNALGFIVEEKSQGKWKFRWVKILTDMICASIGFLFGSTVGIGIIIVTLFTGPLVECFVDLLESSVKEKIYQAFCG